MEAQRKKIRKRQLLKEKIEKEISSTDELSQKYKDLVKKKQHLEMKIVHIKVVIHEI